MNIPFGNAEYMPNYIKFMMEMISNKRKLEDYGIVSLLEKCSAIIQEKLPDKLKDPGKFTMPCVIEQA